MKPLIFLNRMDLLIIRSYFLFVQKIVPRPFLFMEIIQFSLLFYWFFCVNRILFSLDSVTYDIIICDTRVKRSKPI